jgi:hypothetical protein
MDQLQTRLDALEQQVQTLTQHTHTVQRRLLWWRGLAGGVVVLAGLTWALPAVIAQEDAREKGPKGLAQRVAALEELLQHFSREKNDIFITGANLHIVNGLGSTDCTDELGEPIPDCPNSLGNLIVGYNEGAENIRTGSHNVVVGAGHNFSRFGGLVVGSGNEILGDFASVIGGESNTASGDFAVVSGGIFNTANGGRAMVIGGESNFATGGMAIGGSGNAASGVGAIVIGGGDVFGEGLLPNIADGFFTVVIGGLGNTASGATTVVICGQENTDSEGVNTCVICGATVSSGQNITQETAFGWSAGSEAEEVVGGNVRSP